MRHAPSDLPFSETTPFTGLKRRERSRVANIGTQVTRPSGSVLATRGRVARQVVIILEGVATVFGDEAPRRLAAGDQFGVIEVMTRTPHPETILADTSVLLWVLTTREFSTMLHDVPWLAEWYASVAAAPDDTDNIDTDATETPGVDAPRRTSVRVKASARRLVGAR